MQLTVRSAAGGAAVCAFVLYVGAFGHQWASDDVSIIQNNEAAHSIGAAVRAWFDPYWPSEVTQSGQYRPLAIASFALDWRLFGDQPGMFHVTNALWHSLATGLFVLVLMAWVPPLAAAIGGVVFAAHPVHVEAVANVVGRAELMVAAGLFGLILIGRWYRATRAAQPHALAAAVAVLSAALFAKEHAVVAVALLLADEWVCDGRIAKRTLPLYVAVVAVTVGWLFLFRAIASEYVGVAVAATIRDLTPAQRLATMIPAQLDVVRLLVWPFTLAADYNPLVIPRRETWSWVASIGMVTTISIVALGWMAARRAPVVSFGVLAGIISYLPTSNLLFPSGIMLAERNLYLAVVAPAGLLAWLSARRAGRDPRMLALVSVVIVAFGARTVTRIPFWQDGETVLIDDFAEHPENYRNHLRVGGFLRRAGNLPAGLAQTLTAGTIFPEDPWVVQYALVRALDLGMVDIALREARRAVAADPTHPSFARLLVRAHLADGHPERALPIARGSVRDAPASVLAAESYAQVLDSLPPVPWRRALAAARVEYLGGALIAATASATRAVDLRGPDDCAADDAQDRVAIALVGTHVWADCPGSAR